MKRMMLMLAIVAVVCLGLPADGDAVNLMMLGKYDATDQEMGFQVDVMGDLSKHFFVTGGLSATPKTLDGYQGLLGFRLFGPESKYNFGAVGGVAAKIYTLVYDGKASDETYGEAAGGFFASCIFSDKVTGFAGWQYTDPVEDDVAAAPGHAFGVGVILSIDFTEK